MATRLRPKPTQGAALAPATRTARVSRAYEIAAQLEAQIIAGERKPRERLVELELAAHFRVSRAPIREALRMLERDGLVSNDARGLRVAAITAKEVGDVFEILVVLEELYTSRATPHVTQAGLDEMKRIAAQMEKAVQENNIARYFDLNIGFHGVIQEACPNGRLIGLLKNLGKQTLRYRHLAMSLPGRLPVSLEEHRQILKALTKRDAAAAGRAARQSAERAYRVLIRFLNHNPQLV